MTRYDFAAEDLERLEAMIDYYGITDVLSALSDICGAKAEHVAHNWQDAATAKRWSRVSNALATHSGRAEGL